MLGHRVHLSAERSGRRQIAAWLLVCCALVFAVVVVGGVTRLTGSGLSIVEWQPIVGMFPPLTDAQWDAVFHKYQETPQSQKVNQDVARRIQADLLVGVFSPLPGRQSAWFSSSPCSTSSQSQVGSRRPCISASFARALRGS